MAGEIITKVLGQWSEIGLFSYILPFLLIFAIVYAILDKSKILGDNKGVHIIVSLAIGLLSLQFNFVSNFFSVIFPYTGIGLSILLVALILMGLIGGERFSKYVWFGLGAIIFIVIVLVSLTHFNLLNLNLNYSGNWFSQSWPTILIFLVIFGLIFLIIKSGGKKTG